MTAAHHEPAAPGPAGRLHLVPAPEPVAGTAPPLRLRALPQPQPAAWAPGDGDRGRQDPGRGPGRAAGQLALVLHGVPRATAEPGPDDPVPTPSSDLPCPDALARSLVQAAMDVVRGHRPATQVLRWTTPEVYSQLRQRARLEQATSRPGGRRPVVRTLRASAAGPRGVEVSAVVLDGARARAVAARLDGEDGRWRLTALVIG